MKLKAKRFSSIVILAFLFAARAFCQSGDLPAEEFLRLALVASGCGEAETASCAQTINAAAQEFARRAATFATQEEAAENALAFLYEKFLKSYSQLQTRVDAIVESGKYNCVSSSVLFMHLMKTCGIDCVANETADHAFCTVLIGGRKIDVETTNPYGFEPGKQKPLADNRYYKVPAKNYYNRKEISDRRLVALIYENRIAQLYKARKSVEAMPLALAAEELQLGSPQSVERVQQTAVNVVSDYVYARKYEEALDFARGFLAEREAGSMLLQNVAGACSRVLESYTKQNDFEGASRFLAAQADLLLPADYAQFERSLLVNSLNHSIRNEPFELAAQKLAARRGELLPRDFSSMLSACYSKETNRIAKEGGYYAAFVFARSAAQDFPDEQNIARIFTTARQNYAVEVHNKAVPLINRKEYAAARALLEDALALLGTERTLENDLRNIAQNEGRD